MKLDARTTGAAVDRPDPDRRFYLFHGPDESGSRALGQRLLTALGAEKFAVAASGIKEDPASLADEAGAMALFGGPRAIWIEPAGEEILAGVEALLEGAAPESPVIAIGGALRKSSGLLKLAESHKLAVAAASYAPEGANAGRMVVDLGRVEGLSISPDVAARIADEAGGNRSIIASELAKYALFLDAAPGRTRELGHDIIDQLGADSSESELMRLGDLAIAGEGRALLDELERGTLAPSDTVSVAKALLRRLVQVAPMRARIDAGERADAVMASATRSLFFKDKALVAEILKRWDSPRLASLIDRAARLERDLMLTEQPEVALVGEELVTIARAAHQRRR